MNKFIKVDAQSGIGAFGVGNGGGSTIAQACVRAVENSAKTAFTSNDEIDIKYDDKGSAKVGIVQSFLNWSGEGPGEGGQGPTGIYIYM
jgi:hypothetical protein